MPLARGRSLRNRGGNSYHQRGFATYSRRPRPRTTDTQAEPMQGSVRILPVALALLISGCASAPEPVPVAVTTAVPAPVDPLASFEGPRKAANEEFRLMLAPVGIEGVGVIVRVMKAEWTEMDGERTATAVIKVERGDESRTLYLEEGDTKSALGARLHVKGAGEVYDEKTMRYPPYADLVVASD